MTGLGLDTGALIKASAWRHPPPRSPLLLPPPCANTPAREQSQESNGQAAFSSSEDHWGGGVGGGGSCCSCSGFLRELWLGMIVPLQRCVLWPGEPVWAPHPRGTWCFTQQLMPTGVCRGWECFQASSLHKVSGTPGSTQPPSGQADVVSLLLCPDVKQCSESGSYVRITGLLQQFASCRRSSG